MFSVKTIIDVLTPGHGLLVLTGIGAIALHTRWYRTGRSLVAISVLGISLLTLTPMAGWGLRILEDRFPSPRSLPDEVHGIIVLGGAIDQEVSGSRPGITLSSHAGRLTAFMALARRYQGARLAFAGGGTEFREADFAETLFAALGLDPKRIVFERESQTTHQNVVLAKKLLRPKQGEIWVLITSAFHMPRAVGAFRQSRWPVIPYPVDYKTPGNGRPHWPADIYEGLNLSDLAMHELLGLMYYRLRGYSDTLFPAPER